MSIHPTAIIENSTLGNNVSVGPYSVITDATIGDDVTIGCHVDITDSKIASGCDILNKARILDSTLDAGCVIGCEVKGSHLGKKNVGKHMGTVLRSVTSDEGCNFGGGVKFANYDGTGKGTFELGKNVFLGCNTVISTKAGVIRKLEDGVKVGAMCHVASDIPADSLVYMDNKTGLLAVREAYYRQKSDS